MAQVHTRFSDHQVKEFIERYIHHEVERTYIQEILGIGKSRFFFLVQRYREDPEGFSIAYGRHKKTRSISSMIENHILEELAVDKALIDNPDVPIRRYNYSYIKDRLEQTYHERISLPTIIDRAKKNGFYHKRSRTALHDREVMTRYAGELIQHDASYHLWSPPAQKKWYLITSLLDDYSRFILYAALLEKETSWAHITSLESVFLRYGMPFSYYVDSHSIFRFVRGRDAFWQKHFSLTDDATPQWKQVLDDCNVKVACALSPQAKGKIERPYGWLQDRVVRTCVRENVTDINHGRDILRHELDRYNYQQVHSTTMEIPFVRFQNALSAKKSLFRVFSPKPPFESVKDIFCIRIERIVDAYRTISLHNLRLKVNNATPRDMLDIHVYPVNEAVVELRFWRVHQLLDVQKIKTDELQGVHF
jgi:hypothetical protein